MNGRSTSERISRVGSIHNRIFLPEGSPKGVVVMVHGACTSSRIWLSWAERLAQRGLEVWCPDLRGHGESDGGDHVEQFCIEDYVADALSVVGASGGQALVGHDLGGIVAQVVASRTALRGLVLVNTVAPRGVGGPGSVLDIWRQVFRPRILKAILRGATWSYTQEEISSLSSAKLSQEECAEIVSWIGPESGVAAREMALTGVAVEERKVSCAALVVATTFDSLTPPVRQRLIASRYRADYVEFAQHAHFPMLEPGWERPVAVIGRWLEEAARLNGEHRNSVSRLVAARRSATGTPIPGATGTPIPGASSSPTPGAVSPADEAAIEPPARSNPAIPLAAGASGQDDPPKGAKRERQRKG